MADRYSLAACNWAMNYSNYDNNNIEADLCLALDVAAEFKRERDEWWSAYVGERARTWSLEEVLRQMVENCPVCGGSGYNRDAMRVWGAPGAPNCLYCARARKVLEAD